VLRNFLNALPRDAFSLFDRKRMICRFEFDERALTTGKRVHICLQIDGRRITFNFAT